MDDDKRDLGSRKRRDAVKSWRRAVGNDNERVRPVGSREEELPARRKQAPLRHLRPDAGTVRKVHTEILAADIVRARTRESNDRNAAALAARRGPESHGERKVRKEFLSASGRRKEDRPVGRNRGRGRGF